MSDSPGLQFRRALDNRPLPIVGVFNALTARMAKAAGFRAVYQSGAALSAGLAAVPDIGLVTQTEFVQQGEYLARAVDVPVISDADTGFGDVSSVERTVVLYEAAGLAGLHLEDQQLPKRCGHLSGKTLVETSEMVAKIKAAVSARRDPDFVIIARTDARGVVGIDETLDRAKAYVEAGADMVFPEALQSPDEFARFAEEISVPLMANMTEFGKSPLLSVRELGEMGFAAVLFPVTIFRVAMKAAEKALSQLADIGTQQGLLDDMQTRAELYELIDYDGFEERDREYFGTPGERGE
ncbi:MAG: methylisocitrate lyase [Planctomycetaceae bacterium]|jgi:methylisocitrate lyase|nr:methylisocitrate lyase [Planctomycetaceae bacterium]MBT6485990.1 methylisocitrate lyase [Planctomycetaceae bacterium]MBT6493662.1 methylisocitrate lyase [Planctomycetaceae bacterium]